MPNQKQNMDAANVTTTIRDAERGITVYFTNGQRHRDDDLPAVECTCPNKNRPRQMWFTRGVLSRLTGPAVVLADGTEEWYHHGVRVRRGGALVPPSVLAPSAVPTQSASILLRPPVAKAKSVFSRKSDAASAKYAWSTKGPAHETRAAWSAKRIHALGFECPHCNLLGLQNSFHPHVDIWPDLVEP